MDLWLIISDAVEKEHKNGGIARIKATNDQSPLGEVENLWTGEDVFLWRCRSYL